MIAEIGGVFVKLLLCFVGLMGVVATFISLLMVAAFLWDLWIDWGVKRERAKASTTNS